MSSKKRIITLTSRENFVWTSMQEIIPLIENTWNTLCSSNNYDHQIIDVDNSAPSQNLQSLISSDLIVITCFNNTIANYIKVIREQLGIDTRFVFYLHGLATIALWPLQRFQVLHLLTSDDLFIGTCEGDYNSLLLTSCNFNFLKLPFCIPDYESPTNGTSALRPFVYIGRVSPQKNLGTLIKAYSLLNDLERQTHPLIFYGKEDHLGYPNIGLDNKSYLENLVLLIKELKLEKSVFFKGFIDRLTIQKELGTNYIFISPSTHSDENFGMAAFRALLTGVPCVLSAWGGHNEFAPSFPSQINYIKPFIDSDGPNLQIEDLKNAMIGSMEKRSMNSTEVPEAFTLDYICHALLEAINTEANNKAPLKITQLARNIYKQQLNFEEKGKVQQCFGSYTDQAFLLYFKAYLKNENFFCPLPWNHLSVEPSGRVYSCCNSVNFPPLGNLKNQTLDDIWAGPQIATLRNQFLAGVVPTQCRQCVVDEKNKNFSTRQVSLGKFGSNISKLESPTFISLRLDNICNLSCRICSSGLSTSWYKDEKLLNLNPPTQVIEAFNETSWNSFLKNNLNLVDVLYFAGGEPLYSKKLIAILNQLKNNNLLDIQIIINTNFSLETDQLKSVLEVLKSFRQVFLDLSLDGTHLKAEYMRKGQRWNEVEANIVMTRILYPSINLKLSPTISILNVLHLSNYIDHMIKNHQFSPIDFKLSTLFDPAYYSYTNLSRELKTLSIEKLLSYSKQLLQEFDLIEAQPLIVQLNGIIATLRNSENGDLSQFIQKTESLDNIRNENLWSIFPELISLKEV
jgi:radical SAM protein with 4Fe4S-binding SPASM domain